MPDSASNKLLVRDDGHVRTLTINRPERRNSLSRSLIVSLIEETARAAEDDDVWVVVYTAVGTT